MVNIPLTTVGWILLALGLFFALLGADVQHKWLSRFTRLFSFALVFAALMIGLYRYGISFNFVTIAAFVLFVRVTIETITALFNGTMEKGPADWFDPVVTYELFPLGALLGVCMVIDVVRFVVSAIRNLL